MAQTLANCRNFDENKDDRNYPFEFLEADRDFRSYITAYYFWVVTGKADVQRWESNELKARTS